MFGVVWLFQGVLVHYPSKMMLQLENFVNSNDHNISRVAEPTYNQLTEPQDHHQVKKLQFVKRIIQNIKFEEKIL